MLSLITSLYKSDGYLAGFSKALRAFAAGLKRYGLPFELICVANDPTELENSFAQSFQANSWFYYQVVGREALYASWNRGIALAKGEIIGFWNVDDVRYAESIVEAVRLFEKGSELVYFPFVIKRYLKIGSWRLPLPPQVIKDQIPEFSPATRPEFSRSMLCGPFFLFKKSFYERVGPFDEQFKIAGDFDWCARAAQISENLVKAKSLGGEFRVDGGGLSAGGSPRQAAENEIVYIRSRAWDKMRVTRDLIISQYRTKHLLAGGVYRKL